MKCKLPVEGFMPRDQINLVHIGAGRDRYNALFDGSVDAVFFVEPYLSLAEKHGARTIAEAYFIGEEMAGNDVDGETVTHYLRALGKAAEKISRDPRKYVHLLIEGEGLTGELSPAEVRVDRLRYVKPEPYTHSEFEVSYRWMLERGMISGEARYEDVVATVSLYLPSRCGQRPAPCVVGPHTPPTCREPLAPKVNVRTASASTKGRTLRVSPWVYWGTGPTLCLTTRLVRPMMRS